MAMEGLEQSTPPAKVELKSLKSLKVGVEPDDCNPVCPAEVFTHELFVEGKKRGGGWSVFTSRCAAWLRSSLWVPVTPAQLEPLGLYWLSACRCYAKERSRRVLLRDLPFLQADYNQKPH